MLQITIMKRLLFLFVLITCTIQVFSQDAVTLSNVNLRESAGASTKILSKIPKGTEIHIQECANGWCKISFKDLSGYVSSKLIRYASARSNETTQTPQAHEKIKYYRNDHF